MVLTPATLQLERMGELAERADTPSGRASPCGVWQAAAAAPSAPGSSERPWAARGAADPDGVSDLHGAFSCSAAADDGGGAPLGFLAATPAGRRRQRGDSAGDPAVNTIPVTVDVMCGGLVGIYNLAAGTIAVRYGVDSRVRSHDIALAGPLLGLDNNRHASDLLLRDWISCTLAC